ncbi:DUF975 family protein [Carnobacterium gallinarum]|uniref:DUF975 family protein n=1 Tax=Carnobacterium gallinarum TaxID=2749 RepID=UPI00054F3269|nr:DUF975 family protein [Carnobacterium gallinarum]
MKISDYRLAAREKLRGRWGVFALLVLISVLLSKGINVVFDVFLGKDYPWIMLLSSLFLTFAFNYGLFYASLLVSRGQDISLKMIFSGFNEGRYLPLLLINIMEQLVTIILSLILALPFMGILGASILSSIFLSSGGITINSVFELAGVGGFSALAFLTILFVLIIAGIGLLVDGFFQIIVLMRLEDSRLSFRDLVKSSLALLKGNWWNLFLLQISFIGWSLLGIFLVPLLWVIPYRLVSITEFYQATKK